jgi:hypothetical protein
MHSKSRTIHHPTGVPTYLRSSYERAHESLSGKLLIGCGAAFAPRVTPREQGGRQQLRDTQRRLRRPVCYRFADGFLKFR